ncbi:MAG TPA: endonuclease III [Sorangium sp.]|nr:endonuclease III [Sorangium sp.]
MDTPDERKARAAKLNKRLKRAIVTPRCELRHQSPWQLLIATILSAQSTDRTVNRVTPELFRRYPTPAALAAADMATLEQLVRPTGFFRNKAKAIVGASRLLVTQHGGEVPRTVAELTQLPGVARKTANVVLGTAYGISSGITVDTHAGRVARRLHLTHETNPVKVERDLCALFSKRQWVDTGHRLVLHGRYVCQAKSARCNACPLAELCPENEATPIGRWTQRADAENALVDAATQDSLTPPRAAVGGRS